MERSERKECCDLCGMVIEEGELAGKVKKVKERKWEKKKVSQQKG